MFESSRVVRALRMVCLVFADCRSDLRSRKGTSFRCKLLVTFFPPISPYLEPCMIALRRSPFTFLTSTKVFLSSLRSEIWCLSPGPRFPFSPTNFVSNDGEPHSPFLSLYIRNSPLSNPKFRNHEMEFGEMNS